MSDLYNYPEPVEYPNEITYKVFNKQQDKAIRQVLAYASGGAGVDELVELNDVVIVNPLGNQALTYDSDTGLWTNSYPQTATQKIITDSTYTLQPEDVGQWLTYSGGDTEWQVTAPDISSYPEGTEFHLITYHSGYTTVPNATVRAGCLNEASTASVTHVRKVNSLSGSSWLFYGDLELDV